MVHASTNEVVSGGSLQDHYYLLLIAGYPVAVSI